MRDKVFVAGCGLSGIGAVRLLLTAGESVILYDGNETLDKQTILEKIGMDGDFCIILGELCDSIIEQVKYCVISPGIALEQPFVGQLLAAGIPIWSEIELAYHLGKGTVIGITGTNGKTTTTALTGAIMERYYGKENSFVVGNIGTPYTEMAPKMTEKSVTVAEISSFQLETIQSFRPFVSAILNITPDHLNRHLTMDNYIRIKESITRNQTPDDFCVLNYDDEVLREYGKHVLAKVVYFSSTHRLETGVFLHGDQIIYRMDGEDTVVIDTAETSLVGICNYENIMAATAIACCMGVPLDTIRETIRSFQAVEHRIEYTATKRGVKYYNDSKGTNPDAAIQGIKAMTTKTILIGGGYDKGSSYEEWIRAFDGKVKRLLLMGATANAIAATAETLGFFDYQFVENMEEAVKLAAQEAKPGEAVLLSPACASWGMFDNYEQRGNVFKELVNHLPE